VRRCRGEAALLGVQRDPDLLGRRCAGRLERGGDADLDLLRHPGGAAISPSLGSWRGSASVSRSLVSAARSADIARAFIEPAASGTESQNARVPSGICSSASRVSSTSRAQSGHSSMRMPSSIRSTTDDRVQISAQAEQEALAAVGLEERLVVRLDELLCRRGGVGSGCSRHVAQTTPERVHIRLLVIAVAGICIVVSFLSRSAWPAADRDRR
jgi:hypothetical protein